MQRDGIPCVDLTMIHFDITETVYFDDCCHFY